MNDGIRMQLCAFVDGELPENEAELLLRRLGQDLELRKEVAEYLAIGRLIRAEPGLAGADRLHERVTAALEDRPSDAGDVMDVGKKAKAIRPLAGVAIAATVALVAIFVLQQTTAVDKVPTEAPLPVAIEGIPNIAIDAQQERQRQYFLNHAETSSELGANGINSRVVSLRFSEEVIEASEIAEADESSDESEEVVTQP
jgi:sigma-E factor negative regulatory protein RseA